MSLHSSLMVDQMNIYNTTSLQFVHGLLQTVHRWIHWNLSRRSCFRQTHQKRNRQKSMGRQTGRTVCRSFETRSCQADLTGSPWEIPCTYTIRSKPSVYIWHTQNVKSYQCLSSFLSTAWITFQPRNYWTMHESDRQLTVCASLKLRDLLSCQFTLSFTHDPKRECRGV